MTSAVSLDRSVTPERRSQSDVTGKAARVDYVDALRVVLILLVVAHHSVEAYVARRAPEIVFADAPIPRVWAFLAVNAAFFMGFFFFLSAYYAPGSFDRKGARFFITDRLTRLGIPLLLGYLVIVPFAMWLRFDFYPGAPHVDIWQFVTRDFFGFGDKPDGWPEGERWPQANLGPLWFIEHLLIYALLYALWRTLRPPRPEAAPLPPPSDLAIFGYAAALSVASYVVRIWYPQDKWIPFLGFIQLEPAHLPQYASLFVIGLLAGRGRWIETMPRRRGLAWLAVGAFLAILLYVTVGLGVIGAGSPTTPPAGGVVLPSWRPCIWESFTCTALCVGLPVAFRELAIGAGSLWRMLARNVFAIYVFHFPIVLLVQVALMETDLPKWSRLLLTWPIAVVITVTLTNEIVLRIPGLRRIF